MIYLCDIDYNSRTDVFRDVISLINNQCDPRRPRAPPADKKCPPNVQRKQAKRACMFIYIYIYIYIYRGIRILATRVLLIKWLLKREVANKGTEITQNLHLGPEDWLLIEQYC